MNVVLIGMPGSGKSVIGKLAADRLGYDFVDMDDCIVREAGMPIPEIFEKEGEAGFRNRETAALEAMCETDSERPSLIATGGGVVTIPRNFEILRHLGRIVYIKRNVELIAASVAYASDRPLLRDKEKLLALWDARREHYERWADVVFLNEGQSAMANERFSGEDAEAEAAARLAEIISGW